MTNLCDVEIQKGLQEKEYNPQHQRWMELACTDFENSANSENIVHKQDIYFWIQVSASHDGTFHTWLCCFFYLSLEPEQKGRGCSFVLFTSTRWWRCKATSTLSTMCSSPSLSGPSLRPPRRQGCRCVITQICGVYQGNSFYNPPDARCRCFICLIAFYCCTP